MKNELNSRYSEEVQPGKEERPPSLYKVILHHDDFTPKEFVLRVMESFFFLSRREAVSLMETMWEQGRVVCASLSYDVADKKVSQIMSLAKSYEHPLNCSMESAV